METGTTNPLVCKACGVSDYIPYIVRPEGTFCERCSERIDIIVCSPLLEETKSALIADVCTAYNQAPPRGALSTGALIPS